jgi:hypothetical protein
LCLYRKIFDILVPSCFSQLWILLFYLILTILFSNIFVQSLIPSFINLTCTQPFWRHLWFHAMLKFAM